MSLITGFVGLGQMSWKRPNIDWAEAFVFGFIVVTGAILVGLLVKRYWLG